VRLAGRRPAAVTRRKRSTAVQQTTETREPPLRPPALDCPLCGEALDYLRSYLSGLNERGQWDAFQCSSGCGEFEHYQRNGALRHTRGRRALRP